MFKPKPIMAHVLIFISIIVQAQSSFDNSILCYIGADNVSHKVNTYITQEKPFSITCNYDNGSASIPKYLQFTCDGGSTLLSVRINMTDGEHTQVINRDIQLNESDPLYEVPILSFVNEELLQSGKPRITSITFSNNMNIGVQLAEVNFSNVSAYYEIKMNQVFTIDLRSESSMKRYFINANTSKTVSINLYRTDGELDQKINKTLVRGQNFLHFADMQVEDEKYVIVITDYDIKKAPSSKIMVMN